MEFELKLGQIAAKQMGKIAAIETKRRKKKGRPPKNSFSISTSQKHASYDSNPATDSRSTRQNRNPNNFNYPVSEFVDDDEDKRKEKKVKLVVCLPQPEESNKIYNQNQPQQKNKRHSRDDDSESGLGSDSDMESEDRGSRAVCHETQDQCR